MLRSLKRLLTPRAPSGEQRLSQLLATLEQGWSLDAFESLRQLAESGLPRAQFELARRYERALGVVQSLDDALAWYERAAEQGHTAAQARAGLMLLAGPPGSSGTAGALSPPSAGARPASGAGRFKQDVQRAAHWNQRAAHAGHAEAQLRYGLQLAKGMGVEADLPGALDWLNRSAQQGDVGGMTALGVLHAGGYGGVPDPDAARPWLRRAAAQGHADAQYWLGVLGDDGVQAHGEVIATAAVPSSLLSAPSTPPLLTPSTATDTSAPWLLQAAEQGHISAMYRLGLAHWTGRQAERDLSRAETWLRRATSRNHVDAMRALAQMQLEQPGCDGIEAASLLWQAADAGDAESAGLLGELYLEGRGVPRDAVEAARWLVSAGQHARPQAMTALAGLQANSADVEGGHGAARLWLERAAEGGDIAAVFTLGSLHHRGMGVPRDDRTAVSWYRRAADAGSAAAAFYLALLLADVSSDERDDRAALRWLRVASERGHALAVCNWALLVHQGRGQVADTALALRILNRAIARGNVAATTMLAGWLTDGHPLRADPQAAHALIQPALLMNDPVAAALAARLWTKHRLHADVPRLIGILTAACAQPRALVRRGPRASAWVRLALAQLLEARDVAPEAQAAALVADLYESAATDGLTEAQVWMARRAQADPRFDNSPALRAEAQRWWLAAAERGDLEALLQTADTPGEDDPFDGAARPAPSARFSGWMVASLAGHAVAQRELAKRYLAGQGCDPDPFLALRWLQRAADQGEPEALALLATFHAQGVASAPDPARARDAWRRAAGAGHEGVATHMRAETADRLPPTARDMPLAAEDDWTLETRYENQRFAESVELIGPTTITLPRPQGQQWNDSWCVPMHQRSYRALRATLAPVNAWIVPNAMVSAEFVVHKGRHLFVDSSTLLHHEQGTNKRFVAQRLIAQMAACEDDVDTQWQHEMVLPMHNEGGDTWGHFLVQNLPRMLLFLERFPEGKVALPQDHLTHLDVPGPAQMLQALALPRERFIALEPHKRYQFGQVVLMDFLYDFERQLPYPQAIRLIHAALERAQVWFAEAKTHAVMQTACFVRRVPVEVGRQIANEDELLPVFAQFGVDPSDLGAQPVLDQLKAWHSGRTMVSTIGSDLSNLLFAPRGSTVLALTPDWFADTFFYGLAQVCGIRWFELRCGRKVEKSAIDHRSAFDVDPVSLRVALKAALAVSHGEALVNVA